MKYLTDEEEVWLRRARRYKWITQAFMWAGDTALASVIAGTIVLFLNGHTPQLQGCLYASAAVLLVAIVGARVSTKRWRALGPPPPHRHGP